MSLIEKVINRALQPLGFELYPIRPPKNRLSGGQFNLAPIRLSMEASLQHLRGLGYNPSLIVDVGAGHGTAPLLNTWPKATSLWLEPLKEFEPKLQALSQKHPGRFIIAAAGAEKGSLTLHVHGDLYGSSLMQESDGATADGTPRQVPIVRLDDEVDMAKLGTDVLLKVDVQGAELHVLNGAQELLKHFAVVVLETNFFEFHTNSPEFFEVLKYMHDRGFVAYDIFDGHNRPLDDALAQRDVLFVQAKGRFRHSHEWSSKGQREQYFGK